MSVTSMSTFKTFGKKRISINRTANVLIIVIIHRNVFAEKSSIRDSLTVLLSLPIDSFLANASRSKRSLRKYHRHRAPVASLARQCSRRDAVSREARLITRHFRALAWKRQRDVVPAADTKSHGDWISGVPGVSFWLGTVR